METIWPKTLVMHLRNRMKGLILWRVTESVQTTT